MSDSAEALQKWRDQGSLRYLASVLHVSNKRGRRCVTTKQIGRYCDAGWIPGSYRTPKGHRRIRYTDETAEQVACLLKSRREERPIELLRDLIWAIKGTSQKEVTDWKRTFDDERIANLVYECRAPTPQDVTPLLVPDCIYQERDGKDFRVMAQAVLDEILAEIDAGAGWDGFPRSSPEGEALREKKRKYYRALLLQPDLESFKSAWDEATELTHRLMEFDAPGDDKDREDDDENREGSGYALAMELVKTQPQATRLQIAALSLKHRDMPTTAAALARELGISRRALYRTYGKKAIQAALKMVRNDVRAILESDIEKQAKRKKVTVSRAEKSEGKSRRRRRK